MLTRYPLGAAATKAWPWAAKLSTPHDTAGSGAKPVRSPPRTNSSLR